MKKNDGELRFDFQEIPLAEANAAVAAGDGKYSEIKEKLISILPNIAADKAFAFGLPKGQDLPYGQRKSLAIAITTSLARAEIPWKIRYSAARKLFICIPRAGLAPKQSGYGVRSKVDEEIVRLWKSGAMPSEIEKKTKATRGRINYFCYKLNPRNTKTKGGK